MEMKMKLKKQNWILALALAPLMTMAAGEFPSSAAPNFDHEDALLQKYYGNFGKGLYPINHKTAGRAKFWINMRAVFNHALGFFGASGAFKSAYKKTFLPDVQAIYPRMMTDPLYGPLMEKIKDEAGKNWYFGVLTAHMHNSKVPDMANLYFGVSHPVYDVLFDDSKFSNYNSKEVIKRVERIIKRDYRIPNASPAEKLLIRIVQRLDQSLPKQNRAVFFKYLLKLHEAQVDSIYQHNSSISNLYLRRTTFRKGGYSMVLYALLADHNFSQKELDTYFLEGAFLQSLDDFNDILEDKEQGITSLAGRMRISPEDEWKMRKFLHQRFLSLGNGRDYTPSRVTNYMIALDKFISGASSNYSKTLLQMQKEKPVPHKP
jgi:hypothetical protein